MKRLLRKLLYALLFVPALAMLWLAVAVFWCGEHLAGFMDWLESDQ